MIHRSFRFKLEPTPEQESLLWQFAGVTRFVYNLALEQRRVFGRRGRSFNFATQGREIKLLRREADWIAAAPTGPLHQALRDLDRAFSAFFAGRARFPTPRKRGENDSFRFQWALCSISQLNARWSSLKMPGLSGVKLRLSRAIVGSIQSVTISRDALGWFASFACKIEHEAAPSTLPTVGVDRGVANTLALSTGELLSTPSTAHLERRKKRAQRVLARRKRGSVRYRRQRQRVARITAKIARVRADWRHKETTAIAERFGAVALEDLNTASMTRAGRGKRGLNRSILEQGWHAFERVLAYKLDERGGSLIKINPAFTSQECSACGAVDRASRESQASFACRHCGFTGHADTNAAINILRRSTALLRVEGCGNAPDEARTTNHALAA